MARLQRALGVGYTRGTRLLELMEEDGLVGAFNGSKAREVLMTLEEYQAREAAMAEELARIDAGEEAGGDAGEDGGELALAATSDAESDKDGAGDADDEDSDR